jgi:hypothetical protein
VKYLLIGLILTISSNAFATEREFRINGLTALEGFAIAWGVPGEKIDFEKLDNEPEEVIREFIDNSKVVNYLIDLEHNKIISTLTADGDYVDYSIGNYHVGNHFSLSLAKPLAIAGLPDHYVPIPSIVTSMKWESSIREEILFLDTVEKDQLHSIQAVGLNDQIQSQIRAKIKSKNNIKIFDVAAIDLYDLKTIQNSSDLLNEMHFIYSIPKTDDSFEVKAIVKLEYKNQTIIPRVVSIQEL